MKENYPISLPLRFAGFPAAIRMICGEKIPAPYSYGSRVLLYRTPLCGEVQGEYISGAALPDYAMIYSNTGSDTDFDLRISFYGWGTFFQKKSDDTYCTLEIRKGTKIECGSLSKKFETIDLWETKVLASTNLSSLTVLQIATSYSEPSASESIPDGYTRVSDINDAMTTVASDGTITLTGSLLLGGDGTVYYKS
jgi:hypothetical protein